MRLLKSSLAILILFYSGLSSSENITTLSFDRNISSEGFITIHWDSANIPNISNLQISLDRSFNNVIRNINLTNQDKVHLSGFDNGVYYTRLINNNDIVISMVSSFKVEHRELRDAIILFFIGLTVFIYLLVILYRFSK